MTVPFMIDFSAWSSCHTLESIRLLKDNGLTAAITRAGWATSRDTLLTTLVTHFRTLGLPFGLYWYLYPGVPVIDQINKFVEIAKEFPDSTCFFLDLEEYKTLSNVVISKTALEAFYLSCYTKLVNLLPGKKIGIYTAVWCVSTYFPGVSTWIPKTNGWYADYIKYYKWYQDMITSFGGSWGDNTKPISITNLQLIFSEVSRRIPNIPYGVDNWGIWQCVTFIPIVELTIGQRGLDYNILTQAGWKYWFNVDVEPPVKPPVVIVTNLYKVTASILNVRSGPGIQYTSVKKLYFGDIILTTEESNGFVKSEFGWSSLTWLILMTAPPPITGIRYIATEDVYIRETDGLPLGGKIGYVKTGEVVVAVLQLSGWLKLANGGYVSGRYFKIYGG